MNYYQSLNLSDYSSIHDVKNAYHLFKRNYNPVNIAKENLVGFKLKFEAFYFLSDEKRKVKYDLFLKNGELESSEFLKWKNKEKDSNPIWKKTEEDKNYDGLEGVFYVIGEILTSIDH